MAGLKELKTRIASISSTEKITSAMKMIAAARLKKTQEILSRSKSYDNDILTIAGRLLLEMKAIKREKNIDFSYPLIMQSKKEEKKFLLVVFASDRGLCGGYNSFVVKETLKRIKELEEQNKDVKVLCVGKKIGDALKSRCPNLVFDVVTALASKGANFSETQELANMLKKAYLFNAFDVCEVIYTHFNSAINRKIENIRLLPFALDVDENDSRFAANVESSYYGYEEPRQEVFADAVNKLFLSKMFQCLANSQASEHGARMTSMDNATRNAKDMISKLTLKYNRMRQSAITTELIEIISGAEAL